MTWTDAGGELVLFERARGSYHALNGSASAIWRALADGASPDAIVGLLAERFQGDRNAIAEDIAAFLASALAGGLVTEVA